MRVGRRMKKKREEEKKAGQEPMQKFAYMCEKLGQRGSGRKCVAEEGARNDGQWLAGHCPKSCEREGSRKQQKLVDPTSSFLQLRGVEQNTSFLLG